MTKYNRIKPLEAFHLPRIWEGKDAFAMVVNSLQSFKRWAKKHGLRYVHSFESESDVYWRVIVLDDVMSEPFIEIHSGDRPDGKAYAGDWITEETPLSFAAYDDYTFDQYYKKAK